jgi:long-chain fatty acid transport protein
MLLYPARQMIRLATLLALVAGILMAPFEKAYSLGFAVADHDGFATARGDAFSATADNPSAIYYNPAGITQLDGTNLRVGSYLVAPLSEFTPAGSTREYENSDDFLPVPNFYATTKIHGGPVSLGLGINMPFGFQIEYPDNTPFRDLVVKAGIIYVRVNPIIAVQLTESLSVAVGPAFDYSEAKLERGIFTPGDFFKFKGSGMSVGATAGLLWKPWEQHSFGLTYRSPTHVDYGGNTHLRTNDMVVPTEFGPVNVPGVSIHQEAKGSLDFPQSLAVGYSFRPTPKWNFEIDVEWTDWDSLNTVTLTQSTGNIALPFNYKSSYYIKSGCTYYWKSGLNFSVGYFFAENSVPTKDFTPTVPDSDHHVFSVGVGQKYNGLNWNFAYQYTFGPERTVINGTSADGSYEFSSHAFSVSIGYSF